MAENKSPIPVLTDPERFPLLEDLSLLNTLRQGADAPRYNFQSGDRLTAAALEKVKAYQQRIAGRESLLPGQVPAWLSSYVKEQLTHVPFYANRPLDFLQHPTISRKDLAREPWHFVSHQANLNDLLVYQTSGTTGPAMDVNFDAVSQACWIPQLESILQRHQITFSYHPQRVAIALICAQQQTLTYASLSTYLQGAGVLKINLNPADWPTPASRVRYLEAVNPEVLTGDPLAFTALLALKPRLTPRAMVSSAMHLTDTLKAALEAWFQCPVLDIYSLTECRMIACREGDAYRTIRPDLYLEVFAREEDRLLPAGNVGELVVTGGINPFLPLIRYRTGDTASLQVRDGVQYIHHLQARAPVVFYNAQEIPVNNVDISRAMMAFSLAGFTLHQQADGGLRFNGWSNNVSASAVKTVLMRFFGPRLLSVEIHPVTMAGNVPKVTYTSAYTTP